MSNLLETFGTITHQDYNWPYPKPLVAKPVQPPMSTSTQLYLPRSDPDDCKCDVHKLENNKIRYKQLANEEHRLHNELIKVNKKMTNLVSSMLDSACDTDEVMKSIYHTDYKKRGFPVTQYKSLMATIDASCESPITPAIIDLKSGYKDPNRFRYSLMEKPTIQPAKTIHLLRIPQNVSLWDEPLTSRTEYMDNISKMGLSNLQNQQQYLEPLPSSRRRLGNCNL